MQENILLLFQQNLCQNQEHLAGIGRNIDKKEGSCLKNMDTNMGDLIHQCILKKHKIAVNC
jgi:hypothetical protein